MTKKDVSMKMPTRQLLIGLREAGVRVTKEGKEVLPYVIESHLNRQFKKMSKVIEAYDRKTADSKVLAGFFGVKLEKK